MQFGIVAGKKLGSPSMWLVALALGGTVLAGCSRGNGTSGSGGGSGAGGGSGSGGGTAVIVSGNWQIQFTPTNSPAPISSLAGYLHEEGQGSSQFLTAALQAQTSGCFVDASTVPMYGGVSGNFLGLTSFGIDGQTLSIDVTANAGGNQFSGDYSIAGGCADGAKGTATGTQYASLTGTYAGSVTGSSPSETLALSLSQAAEGTGTGTFPLSGEVTFSGITCFSQGTLDSQNGSVIGNSVTMLFTTNDTQGAEVQIAGTVDAAASTLTLSSIQIVGGSCSGSLGSATLLRQQ